MFFSKKQRSKMEYNGNRVIPAQASWETCGHRLQFASLSNSLLNYFLNLFQILYDMCLAFENGWKKS